MNTWPSATGLRGAGAMGSRELLERRGRHARRPDSAVPGQTATRRAYCSGHPRCANLAIGGRAPSPVILLCSKFEGHRDGCSQRLWRNGSRRSRRAHSVCRMHPPTASLLRSIQSERRHECSANESAVACPLPTSPAPPDVRRDHAASPDGLRLRRRQHEGSPVTRNRLADLLAGYMYDATKATKPTSGAKPGSRAMLPSWYGSSKKRTAWT